MRTVLPEDPRQEHKEPGHSTVSASKVERPKWYSTAYLAKVFARRPAQLLALAAFVIIAAVLIYVFAAGQETNALDLCSGTTSGTTCTAGKVSLNTVPTGGGTLSKTTSASAVFPQPDWTSANKEDGRVDAIRRIGNTVYIGGNFTVAQDEGTTTNVTRNHLAAVDASTGKLTSWNPNANGRIYDIEPSSDGSMVFVAGDFTTIGGVTRHDLAALNPTTGAVITSVPDFNFDNFVWVIQIYGSTLYAGGQFTGSLEKINLSTMAKDTTFKATASGSGSSPIKDLTLIPGTTRLIVGGWFTTLNGSSVKYISAVDSNSGATLAWSAHPGQPVLDLAYNTAGNNILAGTVSDTVTSYNATTGAQDWVENTDGNVQAIVIWGTSVIAGMHGDCVGASPGAASGRSQTGCVGPVRHKVFKLNATTGALDTNWDPPLNTTGCTNGTPLGVWALASDANTVYAGGDFTAANGSCNQRFAIFRAS
jgi:hypothetical protein